MKPYIDNPEEMAKSQEQALNRNDKAQVSRLIDRTAESGVNDCPSQHTTEEERRVPQVPQGHLPEDIKDKMRTEAITDSCLFKEATLQAALIRVREVQP